MDDSWFHLGMTFSATYGGERSIFEVVEHQNIGPGWMVLELENRFPAHPKMFGTNELSGFAELK